MDNILFLHGWGGNDKSFAPVSPYFKANYNCIFISFPCFQKTDTNPPDKPWNLDGYADFVIKTLNKQNITECDIIAHSFGARVAVLLADKYPGRFKKLVLTGPAGIPKRFNILNPLHLWRKLKIRLHKLKIIKSKGSFDYRALTDTGKITFQNVIRRDLTPEISRIQQKTLIIWGAKDRSVPRYMIKLWTKRGLNIKLIIYKDAGHFCFIDAPSRFILDTQEFLNV